MLSTVLYYELAMKVPIPVGITVYLLTWGLGHLRCLVLDKRFRDNFGRVVFTLINNQGVFLKALAKLG